MARAKAWGLRLGRDSGRTILVILNWGFGLGKCGVPCVFFFFFFEFHLFLASKETVCLICELWRGFQKRAFVIYDGIHYDVLVRRGPSGPGGFFHADVEVMSVWLSLRRAETL